MDLVVAPEPQEIDLRLKQAVGMSRAEFLEVAETLIVETQFEVESANTLLSTAKSGIQMIDTQFLELISPLNDTRTRLIELRDRAKKPFELAETVLKNKIKNYLVEQKEKAEKAQAEAQAKAQEELRMRRQAEADALRKQGEVEAAKFVEQEAKTEVAATVKKEAPPKLTGTHLTTTWSAELIEPGGLEELVIATAADLLNPEVEKRRGLIAYLKFDQAAANSTATGQKANLNIPGVRPKKKESVAHSTKKMANPEVSKHSLLNG